MRTEHSETQNHLSSPPIRSYGADSRGTPQPKRVACTHCRQSKVSQKLKRMRCCMISRPGDTERLALMDVTVEMRLSEESMFQM